MLYATLAESRSKGRLAVRGDEIGSIDPLNFGIKDTMDGVVEL